MSLCAFPPLIPAALCLLSACQPPTPPAHSARAATETEARQAIDSFRLRYAATWKAANAAAFASLYTTDALLLYPGQPALRGQPAIQTYFEGFFAEFVQQDFVLTSEEIQVTDHWAFDRGTVHWQGIPRAGGAPLTDDGKYLVILERQPDGAWRLARDMDNSDRPYTQSTRGAG